MSEQVHRLLVADDEPDVRFLCRVNLEIAGFDVTEAANGRIAVDMAADEPPDLVILDASMPVLDGWGALEELKATPALAHIPVLILTASADQRVRALEAGAADYLVKPFVPRDLVGRVREHLG